MLLPDAGWVAFATRPQRRHRPAKPWPLTPDQTMRPATAGPERPPVRLQKTVTVERPLDKAFASLSDFATTTEGDPGRVRTYGSARVDPANCTSGLPRGEPAPKAPGNRADGSCSPPLTRHPSRPDPPAPPGPTRRHGQTGRYPHPTSKKAAGTSARCQAFRLRRRAELPRTGVTVNVAGGGRSVRPASGCGLRRPMPTSTAWTPTLICRTEACRRLGPAGSTTATSRSRRSCKRPGWASALSAWTAAFGM